MSIQRLESHTSVTAPDADVDRFANICRLRQMTDDAEGGGLLGADTKLVLRGYTANIRIKRKSCYSYRRKILTNGLFVYVKRHTDIEICVP